MSDFRPQSNETKEDIIHSLKDDEKIQVAGADMDGVLRGKVMKKSKFLSSIKEGFGFCSVIFGWDIHDKVYDSVKYGNVETGFGDINAMIDIKTMRRVPWNNNLPFFIVDFHDSQGKPIPVCPRGLLKSTISKLNADGFYPYSSIEFEFYNFRENPLSASEKNYQGLTSLTPGMFGYSLLRPSLNQDYFNELYDYCMKFQIPLEGLHTETGPGVYEAAIEYSDALTAADRGVLFKTAAKEIGLRHEVMPSFMAKPFPNLPGCSGHTHYSLWDKNKTRNLFWDDADPRKMSQTMKHFLAGQLHCLPYILPLLAPNINSYKRLVENAWAPVVLSWGVENRTSAIRVINPDEKGIRVEMRVSGSDSNAYLAMAASLAAGHYGIKNKLTLQPESTGDNIADKNLGRLPKTLIDAVNMMKAPNSVARELFGDTFVDHFAATREWEWKQFSQYITDWETKRYFELV